MNNLGKFRQQCNLTQEELAEMVGLSSQSISHYERFSSRLTVDKVNMFAEALGCSTMEIIGEDSVVGDDIDKLKSVNIDVLNAIDKSQINLSNYQVAGVLAYFQDRVLRGIRIGANDVQRYIASL